MDDYEIIGQVAEGMEEEITPFANFQNVAIVNFDELNEFKMDIIHTNLFCTFLLSGLLIGLAILWRLK